MCLTRIKVEKVRTRKVYKVLQANTEIESGSKVLNSGFNHTWKRGINQSTRTCTELSVCEKEYHNIDEGFHVYRYKKDAISQQLDYGWILVELIAKSEDYVASGLNNDAEPGMVYTKLYLPKDEYDKKVRKGIRAYEKAYGDMDKDLPF